MNQRETIVFRKQKATIGFKRKCTIWWQLSVTQFKIFPNSSAVVIVCMNGSWDFISNVRSIKGARRQHVISDPNFSKDQHLSMDLNECTNFPHCSNSNFKFSKHTHLWDKWWQIFSILWVPWINGVLSKPLPRPREIYFTQNIVDLTLFGTLAIKWQKFLDLSCKIFGLQT